MIRVRGPFEPLFSFCRYLVIFHQLLNGFDVYFNSVSFQLLMDSRRTICLPGRFVDLLDPLQKVFSSSLTTTFSTLLPLVVTGKADFHHSTNQFYPVIYTFLIYERVLYYWFFAKYAVDFFRISFSSSCSLTRFWSLFTSSISMLLFSFSFDDSLIQFLSIHAGISISISNRSRIMNEKLSLPYS